MINFKIKISNYFIKGEGGEGFHCDYVKNGEINLTIYSILKKIQYFSDTFLIKKNLLYYGHPLYIIKFKMYTLVNAIAITQDTPVINQYIENKLRVHQKILESIALLAFSFTLHSNT